MELKLTPPPKKISIFKVLFLWQRTRIVVARSEDSERVDVSRDTTTATFAKALH